MPGRRSPAQGRAAELERTARHGEAGSDSPVASRYSACRYRRPKILPSLPPPGSGARSGRPRIRNQAPAYPQSSSRPEADRGWRGSSEHRSPRTRRADRPIRLHEIHDWRAPAAAGALRLSASSRPQASARSLRAGSEADEVPVSFRLTGGHHTMTTTHVLQTDNASIAYDLHGPLPTADGRPLLLMIGQPMTASGFRALAAHFSDRT